LSDILKEKFNLLERKMKINGRVFRETLQDFIVGFLLKEGLFYNPLMN